MEDSYLEATTSEWVIGDVVIRGNYKAMSNFIVFFVWYALLRKGINKESSQLLLTPTIRKIPQCVFNHILKRLYV